MSRIAVPDIVLSGAWPKPKSFPHFNPLSSRMGIRLSVLPGGMVHSTTTAFPFSKTFAMLEETALTKLRSGTIVPSLSVKSVGTIMTCKSAFALEASVVATRFFPACFSSRAFTPGSCGKTSSFELIFRTRSAFTSTPTTRAFLSAKTKASGRPIFPKP